MNKIVDKGGFVYLIVYFEVFLEFRGYFIGMEEPSVISAPYLFLHLCGARACRPHNSHPLGHLVACTVKVR